MTEFQEDMLFKNIAEEDAQTILKIFGIESETAHLWTQELRLLDPTTFKPDLILELDDQNLVIEFQSTAVNDDFSDRGLIYVAIANQRKKNNKKVNLEVLSTVESSKIVRYKFGDSSEFVYKVTGLQQFDGEKTINEVQEKFLKNEKISSEESIYFALAPLMIKKNMEKHIKLVVDTLIQIRELKPDTRALDYSIEWFIADKYIMDEQTRILIQDLLGGKMSAIYEYGERKEKKGMRIGRMQGRMRGRKEGIKEGRNGIILQLYRNGMKPEEIAAKTGIGLKTIQKIIKTP